MSSDEILARLDELEKILRVIREDVLPDVFSATKAVFAKAADLAEEKDVDIQEILTGDLVADRALLEAAGVEAEIRATGINLDAALEFAEALVMFAEALAGVI